MSKLDELLQTKAHTTHRLQVEVSQACWERVRKFCAHHDLTPDEFAEAVFWDATEPTVVANGATEPTPPSAPPVEEPTVEAKTTAKAAPKDASKDADEPDAPKPF